VRRKEIELYEIVLAPASNKEKQFKVEVPLNKGSKQNKAYRSSDAFFKFSFNHSEGTQSSI
jgi:hypothetical protein